MDYSQAIKIRPEDHLVSHNRGNSWNALKEFSKAINDYSESINLYSDNPDSHNGRGSCWNALNEFSKALDDYSQAIDLKPDEPIYYNNRGNAWRSINEDGKAINDYLKAIALQPDFAAPYFNLYSIYIDYNENQALYNLNRANYLDFDKIILLIEAYRNTFLLPFMLRRVLYKLSLDQPLNSLLNTYSDNHSYCENWEIF